MARYISHTHWDCDFFFFLSKTTMSTLEDQFVAEEAQMAAEEAEFVKWKAELARLWKDAQEE